VPWNTLFIANRTTAGGTVAMSVIHSKQQRQKGTISVQLLEAMATADELNEIRSKETKARQKYAQ
jgi:hypothetical protein